MASLIQNEVDLKSVKDKILFLDQFIVKMENELIKLTQLDKIEKYEFVLNKLRNQRLGYYLVTKVYEAEIKQVKEKITIQVEEGDTLTDISIAYFGIPDYWEQIYYENNLSDAKLEAGQIIIIPEISNDTSYILLNKEIFEADLTRYVLENE